MVGPKRPIGRPKKVVRLGPGRPRKHAAVAASQAEDRDNLAEASGSPEEEHAATSPAVVDSVEDANIDEAGVADFVGDDMQEDSPLNNKGAATDASMTDIQEIEDEAAPFAAFPRLFRSSQPQSMHRWAISGLQQRHKAFTDLSVSCLPTLVPIFSSGDGIACLADNSQHKIASIFEGIGGQVEWAGFEMQDFIKSLLNIFKENMHYKEKRKDKIKI